MLSINTVKKGIYYQMKKTENFISIISKSLKESLGVPDNIYETSEDIFENLISQLSWSKKSDLVGENGETITISLPLHIADFILPPINFNIKIHESSNFSELELIKMFVSSESEKTNDSSFRLKRIPQKTLEIYSEFIAPLNFELPEFLSFLKEEKNQLVENLSHELKHAYDNFKKEFTSPTERAKYAAYTRTNFGILPIDIFLHDLYFVTASENLVRPTEIVSAIKANKISQKDFIEFLKNHTTYKTLKRISNFNLEDFKKKLKNHIPEIDNFLGKIYSDSEKMSENDKIEEVLRLIYVNLLNWKSESLKEILTTDFLEEILGFSGEKNEIFSKFINRISRFRNYKEFFEYETKNFHYIAEKMIKKIAKVYALTEKSKK